MSLNAPLSSSSYHSFGTQVELIHDFEVEEYAQYFLDFGNVYPVKELVLAWASNALFHSRHTEQETMRRFRNQKSSFDNRRTQRRFLLLKRFQSKVDDEAYVNSMC